MDGCAADFSADNFAVRRRWYAVTDEGDWTEMMPTIDSDRDAGTGVSFLVVDSITDSEFYEQADAGEGKLLGRALVVDGVLTLQSDGARVRG
jgi:hypothetical protein